MRSTKTPTKIRQAKKTFVNHSNIISHRTSDDNQRTVSRQKSKKEALLIKQFGQTQPLADKLDILKQEPKLVRNKSTNILKYLDEKDLNFTHRYKNFKSHSKSSDFEEIKNIIEQLLDKHAVERHLTLSEQYILTGYMGKFIELSRSMKGNIYNSFNITKRLQTKNNIQSKEFVDFSTPKSKRSPSKKKSKNSAGMEEKRETLNKQLSRLKFLWQMYRLKCMICPQLTKVSQSNQHDSHHKMMELMARLKDIQRTQEKVGEEKCLIQVQKVMRAFEQTVKKSLC